jgi:hypothetical protein
MLDIILKKHNKPTNIEGPESKSNNLDLFPDGAHPTSLILKWLVDEYFVPYYNR